MRKVHNCDISRCVTLYCPIENCNQSYDRYNALDSHLTHVHYADIRKETFNFSDLQDFETWLADITSSSKTKYIKRSCSNSYRYYRCHRSGLPKTSTDKINSMKSSVKIGRHCPSRIIAKITEQNVQVEFVPTHIGHECEIAKIPLSQKKRHDIACRLANTTSNSAASEHPVVATITTTSSTSSNEDQQATQSRTTTNTRLQNNNNNTSHQQSNHDHHIPPTSAGINHLITTTTTTNQTSGSTINSQPASTSTIIHNDSSPLKSTTPSTTATSAAMPNQSQLNNPIQLLSSQQLQAGQQTIQHLASGNDTSLALMTSTTPNRQDLTNRFEQLMSAIRSDKHASIVRAQLEVCFALIID